MLKDEIDMARFPYELGKAVEGLNNNYRQEILLALNEVERLSFSDIRKRVDISRPLLASHLKKLSKTLLIEHFYEHEVGEEKFSYYRISPFGKALLGNMLGTLYFRRIRMKFFIAAGEIVVEEGAAAFISHLKPGTKIPMAEASAGERVVTERV